MLPRFLQISVAISLSGSALSGDLSLGSIFSDDAVLQRDQPIRIWGWGSPGSAVSAEFAGQTVESKCATDRTWSIALKPLPASAIGQALRISSDEDLVELQNIVVGDVWHASGQSNMAMDMRAVARRLEAAQGDIDTADLPSIRFCRINAGASSEARDDLPNSTRWKTCSPDTTASFSAAAFYFARRLNNEIGVPIGIIDTSRGGTPIEPFIPRDAFRAHPTLVEELRLGDEDDLDGIWKLPGGVRARDANWLPSRLFHSRISPIERFSVRGVIWYQAESNCGVGEDPRDYRHKMRALINGWRSALGNEALPFYFVQLPGSGAGAGWPYMREQQRLSLGLPKTGMAVSIDLVDSDIHPPYKRAIGERLARWALADTYDREIPPSGPLFQRATIEGNKITVYFSHSDSGLVVAKNPGLAPTELTPDVSLTLFEIADEAGVWHPAEATIKGPTLEVGSSSVSNPVAVRYAYSVSPETCHLYNEEGLPAAPFCSMPDLLTYAPEIP